MVPCAESPELLKFPALSPKVGHSAALRVSTSNRDPACPIAASVQFHFRQSSLYVGSPGKNRT